MLIHFSMSYTFWHGFSFKARTKSFGPHMVPSCLDMRQSKLFFFKSLFLLIMQPHLRPFSQCKRETRGRIFSHAGYELVPSKTRTFHLFSYISRAQLGTSSYPARLKIRPQCTLAASKFVLKIFYLIL